MKLNKKQVYIVIVLIISFVSIYIAIAIIKNISSHNLDKYYTYKTQYSKDITTFKLDKSIKLNEKTNVGLGQEIQLDNTNFKVKLTKLAIFDCTSAYKETGIDYCDWGDSFSATYEVRLDDKLLTNENEYPYLIETSTYFTKGYAEITVRPLDFYCQKYSNNNNKEEADKCFANLAERYKNINFCEYIVDKNRKDSCKIFAIDSNM